MPWHGRYTKRRGQLPSNEGIANCQSRARLVPNFQKWERESFSGISAPKNSKMSPTFESTGPRNSDHTRKQFGIRDAAQWPLIGR
jgi:hypothetical protein